MPSAAILVGGLARRFGGGDKSAIHIGGRTILDRQIDVLRPVADDIMLVGLAPEDGAPAGVRALADRVPGAGPLGGLDTALAAARHDPLILLACDMPYVTTALLEYLINRAPLGDAVVPHTARGYHPLCAVYARACQPAIARRLGERRLTMRDFLGDVRVHAVEQDEIALLGDVDRLLTNVNTRAELDEIQARFDHTL